MLVFQLQEQHQKHTLLSSVSFNRKVFLNQIQTVRNSRELQIQYLALQARSQDFSWGEGGGDGGRVCVPSKEDANF